ncbi:MAG: alcohol dehydrogenase, partial [Chthoniobacteraceae bacterium]
MHVRTVLPLLFLSATLHAVDWPQYRGPKGDGTTTEVLAKPWAASGPKQLWKIQSPNGFSSFAVAGERVFTLEGRNVDGATQEVLVARDANSGKELWAQTLGVANYGHDGGNAGTSDNKGGDGPRSTPSIHG